MKILVLAQRFPPDMSGSCTRAWNIVKGLKMLGNQVTIISGLPRDPWTKKSNSKKAFVHCTKDHLNIFRVWLPPFSYSGFKERLLLHISFMFTSLFPMFLVDNFDVIWAANPNFFSMFPATIYSIFFNKPIVRNVDDLWPEAVFDIGYIKSSFLRKFLLFISKITYIIPKAITPISNSYKKDIVRHYNISSKKISVIEHGVDLSFFYPTTNYYKNDKNKFVVMYSGKLGVAYDFDVVLEAAKKLENYKNIIFIIRGFGEEAKKIRAKINNYNSKNVILDTTYLDKSKLQKVLNSANVFLLPNKPINAAEQGLPTKILEYQACGKPIICCSEGEACKYLTLTKSGLVVKPEDPKALADAILKLFNDNKLAQRLGDSGWTNISKNLSLQKVGERMEEVFSKVIKP